MLISLLADYHQQIETDDNHPLRDKKHHIHSYHEVIGALVGKAMGTLSLLAVFLARVAQILAVWRNVWSTYLFFGFRFVRRALVSHLGEVPQG